MQRSATLRLIRCDAYWKVVPWITLGFALLATVPQKAMVWFAYAWIGACVGMRGSFRANRFLSSLPFEGRSIFLVRFTAAMALLWCPAIAGLIVWHAWIGAAAGFELLSLAGFYTALFLLEYAIRIEMFQTDGLPGAFLILGFAGVGLAWLPVVPTAIVEMTVIALLMIRVWKTVPRSFRLVPRPSSACFENILSFLPTWSPARLPLLRFVWGWYNVWILPVILFTSGRHFALFFTAIVMPTVWTMFHGGDRWLRTLPISPRRLLRMFVLPILVAVVGGAYLSLWSAAPTVHMQIVSVAVAVGLTLFQCIFWAFFHGYRPVRTKLAGFVVQMALIWGWIFTQGKLSFSVDPWKAAIVRASSHIPDFLLLFLAIAILALLYAVLEWVFAGSEYRNPSVFRQEKS